MSRKRPITNADRERGEASDPDLAEALDRLNPPAPRKGRRLSATKCSPSLSLTREHVDRARARLAATPGRPTLSGLVDGLLAGWVALGPLVVAVGTDTGRHFGPVMCGETGQRADLCGCEGHRPCPAPPSQGPA